MKDNAGSNQSRTTHSGNLSVITDNRSTSHAIEWLWSDAKVEQQVRFVKAIYDTSPNAIYLFDVIERKTLFNSRGALQVLGYSTQQLIDMGGELLPAVMHPDDAAHMEQHFAALLHSNDNETPLEATYRLKANDGQWRWFHSRDSIYERDADGRVRLIVGTAQDITEYQTALDQLSQMQKMEAIGNLAGGVAHDFNNLLSGILGYAELLQEQSTPNSTASEYVEAILGAGERARDLAEQLLAFARKQPISPEYLDINRCLHELQPMLRRLLREDIRLEINCAAQLPMIWFDATQLDQIIMNLALNAQDAMIDGGRLALDVYTRRAPNQDAQPIVIVEVTDTGTGMREEQLQRIFEPFYTTKQQGNGLGLSTVYALVKQHEGRISVKSTLGKGSCFILELPARDMQAAHAPLVGASSITSDIKLANDTGAVLIVEDDSTVRTFMVTALRAANIKVFSAGGTAEARALMQECGSEISLLLSDVVMPDGSGVKLYQQLNAVYPQLNVLYVSGYDAEWLLEYHDVPRNKLLFKPVQRQLLVQRIKRILRSARYSAA
ncbi:MAG: PAS domain-containing protein [Gammaproteobacteria bacterium]|nr:PAS domain-containing protein [Gammaproteobacteria bacterium]